MSFSLPIVYQIQTKSYRSKAVCIQLLSLALLFFSGCDSGSSDKSSNTGTATISGNIVIVETAKGEDLPPPTSLTHLGQFLTFRVAFAQVGNVLVTVKDTDILATTDNDGNFELEGVLPGTVTIIFLSGGNEIGSITFNGVQGNSTITLLNIRIKADEVEAADINVEESMEFNNLLVKSGGNPEKGVVPFNTGLAGEAINGTAPFEFKWEFGDGTSILGETEPGPAEIVTSLRHTFETLGLFIVTLTMTDAEGKTGRDFILVNVEENEKEELEVRMGGFPDIGVAPLTVQFVIEIENAFGDVTFEWDFGDGSPKTGEVTPIHTYDSAGVFRALVIVEDSAGQVASKSVKIGIAEDQHPIQ
ncbi:PKD domain-containing protein [Desulfobacterota bacterium AH_259_B03_O07]|nr:PKD domain-containing protein [Desulfobacterota bacterium AH_259_B03_O07]